MGSKREKRVAKPVQVDDMALRRRPKTEATTDNNIRNWRLFKGVETHDELCDMTVKVDKKGRGVNRVTLSRLESGWMRYNQDQVELIATALGVSPGDLISTNPYKAGDIFTIYALASVEDRRKLEAFARKLKEKPQK